jgi:hypothetical protein
MRKFLPFVALPLAALMAFSCSKSPSATAALDDADAGDDAGLDEVIDAGVPCEGSGIQKGPWVAGASLTSVIVRWETCRAGSPLGIHATTASATARAIQGRETPFTLSLDHDAVLAPKAPKDYAGMVWTHEAVVDGLNAGTCGTFSLDGDATKTGAFCTLRAPTDELQFVAIGDTNPGLLRTAPLLPFGKTASFAPDFVIHLGDIQYYDSRLETWASWFPLMQPLLGLGGFFPVIGNHEFENPTDFPEFFLRFFASTGFKGTDRWHMFESAGIAFIILDTESPMDDASEQGTWMKSTLSALEARKNDADYRGAVVGFHKPFLTCGDTYDNAPLLALWEPRYIAAGVATVLAGHMHGYERFDHGGRPWVVTGGGGGAIRDPNQNMNRAYCNERTKGGAYYHLMRVHSEGTKLHMDAVDDTGTIIDAFDAPLLRGPKTP